jgi:hypothetical protein
MIKLVLPICKKQAPMVARLVHRFKQFGDMRHRDIVIIAPWEDHFEVPDLEKFLAPLFKSVETFIIPDVPELSEWPQVGNHTFYETVKALRELGNKESFYFFECDNWPLYPFWLDDIQSEFDAAGKPFYGVMNATRRLNKETGETVVEGRHMVGTGVYPADIFEKSLALHTLTDAPWDIAMQNELEGAVHETQLICHRWNTGRYKKTAGIVTCDDLGPNKGRYGLPIPPEAVVVHGCKDGSIAKIDFGRREATV